jgi:hypothetical protein
MCVRPCERLELFTREGNNLERGTLSLVLGTLFTLGRGDPF